jgi:hypothetical protein
MAHYRRYIFGISLCLSLFACGTVRYQPVQSGTEPYSLTYNPVAPTPTAVPAADTRIQEIEGNIFHLYLMPENPRVNQEVEIDLAVEDAAGKPVKKLDVSCRSIHEDHFFISQCKKPYTKNAIKHHVMSIVYESSGQWQLRFDVKTEDGRILNPVFNITVGQ